VKNIKDKNILILNKLEDIIKANMFFYSDEEKFEIFYNFFIKGFASR
jgi:hypothetical protein